MAGQESDTLSDILMTVGHHEFVAGARQRGQRGRRPAACGHQPPGAVSAARWGRLAYSVVSQAGNAATARPPGGRAGIPWAHLASQNAGVFVIELAATACVAIGYYWLLTSYWGTTIGKRCLGLWVARLDGSGRAGPGAALARAAVFVLAGWAVALFFLADNLWLVWDGRRQCLHDKIARTIVIRSRPLPRESPRAGPVAVAGDHERGGADEPRVLAERGGHDLDPARELEPGVRSQ